MHDSLVFGWLRLGNIEFSTAVTTLLSIIVAWLIYYCALQPLISPLRKIPGLPYFPFVGNLRYMMQGQMLDAHIGLVKQFGPIARFAGVFGRNRILVADPELLKYILVTNGRNYIKPQQKTLFMRIVFVLLGEGLVTSEGTVHAMHKRLMAPAFSRHAITKFIPLFESRTQKLVELWSKIISESDGGHTAVLSVNADIQRTTLDIMGIAAFGYDFNSLTNPDHKVTLAAHSILTDLEFSWRIAIPFYTYLPFPDMLRFHRNIRVLDEAILDIISKKRELLSRNQGGAGDVADDVLTQLIGACDEETNARMTNKQLRDQVMTLMIAGHETTATGMSWCLLLLAKHQHVQEKAREEILSIIGSTGHLDAESIEQLEYCGCVVKETLRLLPPVAATIRTPLKDDTLPGGHFIPAGTIMLLSLGAMMRRDDVYSDGETFRPERFLEKDAESNNQFKFAPFLYGTRQCLGYRFALIEMNLMLAMLLRNFRFELDPASSNCRRSKGVVMKPKPSLKLRVSSLQH